MSRFYISNIVGFELQNPKKESIIHIDIICHFLDALLV